MKVVLIVIGVAAAGYTLLAGFQLVRALTTSDPATAGGGSNIAASIIPVCVGLAVAAICFQRAFARPKA